MKQTGRNKFSFSAFLFSGAWMLYRKQYKQGAVITGLMLVIYLLYLSSSIFVATPALMSLMEQAGMDVVEVRDVDTGEAVSPESQRICLVAKAPER